MSQKVYKRSLFLFRRDLRISDNRGFMRALVESREVIPAFIVNPAQVGPHNQYRSHFALQFMRDSLEDLAGQIRELGGRLQVWHGDPVALVKKLCAHRLIDALYINADYTPYSIARDAHLDEIGKQYGIAVLTEHDALLTAPGSVLTKSGNPYKKFTPFYHSARALPVDHPARLSMLGNCLVREKILDEFDIGTICGRGKQLPCIPGGSEEGHKLLKKIDNFVHYEQTRDTPSESTTHLSAHLKFGTLSVRQVFWHMVTHLGVHHPLLRQLYWRDFFTHIAFHFPQVFGAPFYEKYARLKWASADKVYERWCAGTTGYPLVDAGMRELVTTGFMHNRVRMVAASFLVKDLHIDWRVGERFFAQHLVDYDPAVNNGNWQWVASTGCDVQPYFRIFNPSAQAQKYDPQSEYIRTWVSEFGTTRYPQPIIDHAVEAKRSMSDYKKLAE